MLHARLCIESIRNAGPIVVAVAWRWDETPDTSSTWSESGTRSKGANLLVQRGELLLTKQRGQQASGPWQVARSTSQVGQNIFRVLLLLPFPSLASPNALSRRAGKHSRTVGALPLENRCELLAVTFWSCCFLTIAIVRLRAGPGRTRVPRLPFQLQPIQIVLSEHQVPSGELSHQACRRRFRWHGLHDV